MSIILELIKKDREESRKILLEHLRSKCQGNYKLENWDYICVRINDFMNARKKMKEYLENITNNDSKTGKWIAKNMLLNDIKSMEKEIIKEVREQFEGEKKIEVECKVEIPALVKFELIAKLSNHKCCLIM